MLRFFQKVAHLFIYGKSYKLGRLENACLSEWQNSLPPDVKAKMIQQLGVLTFIQRQLGGKMLVFSNYSPDVREKNNSIRLNLKGETRLAVLSVEADGLKLNAELWSYNGLFHSICYNRTPPAEYSEVSVRLLKSFVLGNEPDYEPIYTLPSDYDTLYAIKEELEKKGAKLFSKANITRIPISELWYSVLCQIDDRYYVAHSCDSEENDVVLYDFIDNEIIKTGETMKELLDFVSR